jgi:hypothetical protein
MLTPYISYYTCFRITKEKTWKRPKASTAGDDISVLTDDHYYVLTALEEPNSSSSASKGGGGGGSSKKKAGASSKAFPLPPNWKEVLDKKSNRVYYVNT